MRFQHEDIDTYIQTYIHTKHARTHTHSAGKTHFLDINAGGKVE